MPTVKRVNQRTIAPKVSGAATNIGFIKPVRSSNAVGQGLVDLGASLGNIQQRKDENIAVQAETDFYKRADEILFTGENAYYNTKGQTAFDGAKGITTQLNELKEEFMSNLENNQQRQLFSRSADKRLRLDGKQVASHAAKELEVWDKLAGQARLEQAKNSAKVNYDPESITDSIVRVQDEVNSQARKNNVPPEARMLALKTEVSATVAGGIKQAIDNDQLGQARFLVKKFGDQLTADDKTVIEDKLEISTTANTAQFLSDRIRKEGGSRGERLAKANTVKDEKVRKLLKQQVVYDYTQEKLNDGELQVDARKVVDGNIANGMPLTELQKTVEYQALNGSQKLSVTNVYKAGGKRVTDVSAYVEMRRLISEKTKSDPDAVKLHYYKNAHLFSISDATGFADEIFKDSKSQTFYDAQDIVSTMTGKLKDDEKGQFMYRFNQWYSEYERTNHGAEPTSADVYQKVDNMLLSTGGVLGMGTEKKFIADTEKETKAINHGLDIGKSIAEELNEPLTQEYLDFINDVIQDQVNRTGKYPSKTELRKILRQNAGLRNVKGGR